MIKLAPSILSADFAYLADDIKKVERGGAPYLHIDVMDGMFVPNISFGSVIIKSIRKHSDMIFDVHLMIDKPERYIEEFAKAGADIITFHVEATENVSECIKLIKSLGKKAGISIKPKTSVDAIKPYLNELDMVLVMSVEPGFGGQKYMACADEKIAELKKICAPDMDISVDGGIGSDNLAKVVKLGANTVVAGSAVFGTVNAEQTTREFMKIASDAEKEIL